MKIFKFLAYFVGIILVLIAAALFAFTQYFDANKYKDHIIQYAQPYIGDRELNIKGELEVSVFPWIGINAGAVSLSQPLGFAQGDMLRFERADIKLKLAALLQGNIEVDKVELIQPYVHLITKENGQTNYSDLLGNQVITKDSTETHSNQTKDRHTQTTAEMGDAEVITSADIEKIQTQDVSSPPAFDLHRLQISGVALNKGTVLVENRKADTKHRLENLTIELGEIRLGQPLQMQLGALVSASNLPHKVNFDFNGNLETNDGFSELKLYSSQLKVLYGQLPVEVSIPAMSYKIDIDSLSLPALKVTQEDMVINSALTAFNLKTAPNITGSFEFSADNIFDFMQRLGIQRSAMSPEVTDSKSTFNFDFEANQLKLDELSVQANVNKQLVTLDMPTLWLDTAKQILKISKLTLEHELVTVNLENINASNIFSELSDIQLASGVDLVMNQPQQVLANNGYPGILKPQSITQTSLQGKANLANNSIRIDDLNFIVDDMITTGYVAINNLNQPAYDLQLEVNEVDIHRLMNMMPDGPSSSQQPKNLQQQSDTTLAKNSSDIKTTTNALSTDSEQAQVQRIALPIEPLRSLNIQAKVSINRLLASGLTVTALDALLQVDKGLLQVKPMSAKVANGNVNVNLVYDVTADVPKINLDNSIQSVNVGDVLRALKINDQLEGSANITTKLSGQGAYLDTVMSNLNGVVETKILDGAVRGIDLQSVLIKVENTLNSFKDGEREQAYQPDVQTKFAELSATFDVNDGVFKSDNISMKAPALRLDGSGNINLPKENLDMRLGINVVKTVEGQGGANLEELEGVRIPLKVTGALSSPSFGIDFTALLKERAERELKKKLLQELPGKDEKVEQIIQDPKEALKQTAKEKLAEELFDSGDEESKKKTQEILEDPGKALEDAAKKELQKGLEKLFNF